MTETITQEITGDGTLPKGWARADLGEILDVVRGISFPSSVKRFEPEDGYIACLRTTNVQRDVEWDDLWFVPEEHLKREEQRVKPLDILISTANSFELVGKVAQVYQMPVSATLGAFISLIRVPTELDAKYVYLLLTSNETQSRIRGLASTTTNISNVSTKKLKTLALKIPPLNEQRRIVEKIEELFTKLDAGVRSLEQARAQLKSYRRSVLKAAVEGELSREWREAHKDEIEPASEVLERILQERREKLAGKKYKEPTAPETSELSTLPETWEWASLEQLSWDSGYGTSSKCGYDFPGPPVLRIPNISRARVDLEDIKFANSEANLKHEGKVAVGDLLIIRTNGSRDLIGRAAVVKQSLETDHFFASYLIRYRLAGGDPLHRWVETIWHSQGIRSWMQGTAATSAGQYNISVGALNKLVVPLPPQEEMNVISEEVERRLSVVDKLEATVDASLKQANALRQSILKRAFSGELVGQDHDDEPASALLEWIREERQATKHKKPGRGRSGKTGSAERVQAEQGGLF